MRHKHASQPNQVSSAIRAIRLRPRPSIMGPLLSHLIAKHMARQGAGTVVEAEFRVSGPSSPVRSDLPVQPLPVGPPRAEPLGVPLSFVMPEDAAMPRHRGAHP